MRIVGKIWIVCVCGSKRLTAIRRLGHSSFLFLRKYTEVLARFIFSPLSDIHIYCFWVYGKPSLCAKLKMTLFQIYMNKCFKSLYKCK